VNKDMKKIKQMLKKKRILFPLIFFGEIAITIIIAHVFGLETSNSPLGAVFSFVMGFTFIIFLLKIIKDHKAELIAIRIPFIEISIIWVLYLALAQIILAVVLLPFLIIFVGV